MIPTRSVSLPLPPLNPTSHCSHISLSNLAPRLTLSCFICFQELVVNVCESKQLICLDTGSHEKKQNTPTCIGVPPLLPAPNPFNRHDAI